MTRYDAHVLWPPQKLTNRRRNPDDFLSTIGKHDPTIRRECPVELY